MAPTHEYVLHQTNVQTPVLHCVLVHGTFARDSEWTRENSFLTRELLLLEPGGVTIGKFVWSGKNRHDHRILASAALRERLASEAAARPNERILIVAHSHGGNIAMSAVDGVPEHQRAGIVCLGTPFCHVRCRSIKMLMWLRAGLSALPIMGVLCGMGFLGSRVIGYVESGWYGRVERWFTSLLPGLDTIGRILESLGGALQVILALCFCGIAWVLQENTRPAGLTKAELRWKAASPHSVRTLCIWFAPDEAYWFLKITRLSGEWVHAVVSALATYGMPVITGLSIVSAFSFGLYRGFHRPPGLSQADALYYAASTMVIVMAIAVATPIILWAIGIGISFITMLSLGTRSFSDHFWLDIHTARIPQIDACNITVCRLSTHEPGILRALIAAVPIISGPLVHSRAYLDLRTPREIAKWYRSASAPESRSGVPNTEVDP
ncbi:hypothetical protein LMG27952_02669 [Paraburkholderia hiiakae]|uniref:AB hydrolase-1 domain-containing protein n=2 Tax=Paraburkholderia hiiakae TaxID=1081782 RepID=A0ABM8NM64_9BURK|nr:hypothetical protein LMG27952_02669 [Paraburkholderia hiiakae]